MRVVRFYVRCASPRTSSPRPSSSFSFLLLAGSHLPALDRSGPRRTSSASSWSQGASPDLICQLLINSNGPRRTSTGEGLSAVGLAGLQPARVGALWALPDFNWLEKMSERMSDRMPDRMSERMPNRMSERMSDRMPDRMSERMPDKMPDRMPDRMPDGMSDRMGERTPHRMPVCCLASVWRCY